MIDRLTELDTKAAGTPEKKDASGKVTPAEPGILTLAEKNEREQLRSTLGYTGQFPPDVAFSPVDLAPKAEAQRHLDDEQAVARVEARTDSLGKYRLCGVPLNTALVVRAVHDGAAGAPLSIRIVDGWLGRADLVLDRLPQAPQPP